MTPTYQSIGAKVVSIPLNPSNPHPVPLALSANPQNILLRFRVYANLTIENKESESDILFRTPADIFVPVTLLQTPANAIEVCHIIESRLYNKLYILNLRSLIPLSDTMRATMHKILEDSALPKEFARYFSPDSTTIPAFIYNPDPTATFFEDLKDVLRPMT